MARLAVFAISMGVTAGLALGAFEGWPYAAAGFPVGLVQALAHRSALGLGAALAFLAAHGAIGWLLRRLGFAEDRAGWAAALLAWAPVALWTGLAANRAWALRPRDLASLRGLAPNLALGAVLVAAGLAVAWCLERLRRRAGRARLGPAAAVAAFPLALALACSAAARPPDGGKPRPDVILVVVDALRPDHLGCYGYPRPTSPAIDAFAADAVRFADAVSHSTFTKSSIASLFTSRHPYQHGVYWGSKRDDAGRLVADTLSSEETTLAEALRERGYLTAAWVQNTHLRRSMGFAQGFVDYNDQQGESRRLNRRFFRFLGGPGLAHPFFAYLHWIDLHDPYRPEPPYDSMFGTYGDPYAGVDFGAWGAFLQDVREGRRALSAADLDQLRSWYDGLIRSVDAQFARLIAELRDRGLYERSLVVVTSDHGDAFMEHGFLSHSTRPYEEVIRVPLLVKLPGNSFAGRVVEEQVRLIDVLPTALDAAGLPPLTTAEGCSLLARLGGEAPERDPGCGVAISEVAIEGEGPSVAVRTGGWKYILSADGGEELYDLAADPGERRDRTASDGEALARLRRVAVEVAASRRGEGDQMVLDERLVRELKALGYVR